MDRHRQQRTWLDLLLAIVGTVLCACIDLLREDE